MISADLGVRPYSLPPRCAYQMQHSRQTLAEAMAEYYHVNRNQVFVPAAVSRESQDLFRNHDICHVIFGLDTTMADEILTDWRTRLSSDVGWMRYASFFETCPEVKPVFKRVGYATIALATARESGRINRAIREAARTSLRWPWSPPEAFMRRTLSDLRAEHGIRVI